MAAPFPAEPASAHGRVAAPRLIGRDAELGALRRAITEPPGVIWVEGEAGVGKTRLVREVVAAAAGDRLVLWGGCVPQQEPPPYFVVVEALRSADCRHLRARSADRLLGALRPLLPEWSDWLPPRPDVLEDARAERHQLMRALRALLVALGPAVLVLEDLHWADDSTLEVVRYLAAELPPALSLVITCRTDNALQERVPTGFTPEALGAVNVPLAALGVDELAQLVEGLLDTSGISDEFAKFLHDQSGGLPFAAEELVHLMLDRGLLIQMGGRWLRPALDQVAVPPAVAESVRTRAARLSPEAGRFLEAAAVLNRPATELELAEVAGTSEDLSDPAIAELLRAGLLVTAADRFTVRHALISAVVAEELLPGRRRRLHGAAADVLRRRGDIPALVLAEHYRAADRSQEWVSFAEQAVEAAMAVYDDDTACRMLLQLLQTASISRETEIRLAFLLGEVAKDAAASQPAIVILERVLARHGPHMSKTERGSLRFRLAVQLFTGRQDQVALSLLEDVISELGDQHPFAVRAMCWLAMPIYETGTVRRHLAWMRRAESAVRELDDELAKVSCLAYRAAVDLCLGRRSAQASLTALHDRPDAPIRIRRQLANGLINAAEAATDTGLYGRAEELIAAGDAMLDRLAYHSLSWSNLFTKASLCYLTGRWSEARRLVEIGNARQDLEDHARLRLVARLLEQAWGQAEPSHFEDELTDIAAEALRMHALPTWVRAQAALAHMYLELGRLSEADQSARRAADLLSRKGVWAWAGEPVAALVAVLTRGGELEQARSWTARLAAAVRSLSAPVAAAQIPVCRALIAEAEESWESAARLRLSAAAALGSLPRPYDAAMAREAAARALVATGRHDDARSHVVAALETYAALPAPLDLQRARGLARQYGLQLPYPWRGGRRAYGDELSPREQEVVDLVAEGMSIASIAERLSLSPRTVETHLVRARRKNGGAGSAADGIITGQLGEVAGVGAKE